MVTGVAGFIGFHVASRLLERGDEVVGIDNLNEYYDPAIKKARLERLSTRKTFHFSRLDVADNKGFLACYERERPNRTIHLAAQAGVRYSLLCPQAYVDSNLTGFLNILEACRHHGTEHLVFASSSSVYGANKKPGFATRDGVDHPISLYAATKRANELMAHSYSHLFSVPATGLRFFTAYGPWGRPDMALFIFTRKILRGEPIPVFNHGRHSRDFTYIDDIAEGVIRVVDRPPMADPNYDWTSPTPESGSAAFKLYNIGHGVSVPLLDYVKAIEEELGIRATYEMLPMQPGDVESTVADISAFREEFGYIPETSVKDGVTRFVRWYKDFYKI